MLKLTDEEEVHRCILAATGYCELGMWDCAWTELDSILFEGRSDREMLRLCLYIVVGFKLGESAGISLTIART